jgi:phosphoserine phosphatase
MKPTAPAPHVRRLPSPAEVVASIAAVPAGRWIATDADNTIWAGDVGDEVIKMAAQSPDLWPSGLVALDWYLHEMEHGDYHLGCCYAAKVWALLPADLQEEGHKRLDQWLAQRVKARRWLMQALQQAVDRGVEVVIISASPGPTVAVAAQRFGLQTAPVLGLEAALIDGEPVLAQPIAIGAGKVAAWQATQRTAPALALGDSPWDVPLLNSAEVGLWLTRAVDDPWVDASLQALPL